MCFSPSSFSHPLLSPYLTAENAGDSAQDAAACGSGRAGRAIGSSSILALQALILSSGPVTRTSTAYMPDGIPALACSLSGQLIIEAERLNILLWADVASAAAAADEVRGAAGRGARGGLGGSDWDQWRSGGGGAWLVHVASAAAAGAHVGVWAGWEGWGWLGECEAHFDGLWGCM